MELWSILQKNQALRQAHAGRRCFIIANGPSLKRQDLRSLRDEITIVVNSFYMHPDIEEIRPKYWVLADPLYWESPEQLLLPTINAILSLNLNVRLLMPSAAIPTMARLNYGPLIEPFFFHYDSNHREPVDSIDFTRAIPPFAQTVVIPALMLAYYLGCNPIYLLGCDHDWFGWTAETYAQAEFPHFYQKDGNPEAEVSHQDLFSFEEISRIVGIMKHQYLQLREYGQARGFNVYNATEGGHLEIFPRVDYAGLVPPDHFAAPYDALVSSLVADARHLAESAIRLLHSDDPIGALVLVDRAIEANTHRFTRVIGLEYLKAICLARLGAPIQSIQLSERESPDHQSAEQQLIARLQDEDAVLPEVTPSILGFTHGGDVLPVECLKTWARDHTAAGERCFNDADLVGALREFQMALDLDPEGAPIHNNLGVLFWQAGLEEKALVHFERARALDRGNFDSLLNCINAYRSLGRFEEIEDLIRNLPAQADPEIVALLEEISAEKGAIQEPNLR